MAQPRKTPRLATSKIAISRSSASEISRALGITERDQARARRIVEELLAEHTERGPAPPADAGHGKAPRS